MDTPVSKYVKKGRAEKFTWNNPLFTKEKQQNIKRLMFERGPGNGKLLILPIDHGMEHGPSDMLDCPWAINPEHHFELALKGNYNAIAVHIGLAEKYWKRSQYNKIPLILKVNGKTNIPSSDEALSSLTSSVEDALRLGATAVGYTLYVGSPRQDKDFEIFNQVRKEALKANLPVIMWAYPRGKYVKEMGGKNNFAAVSYGARVACELGADIVKVNEPELPELPDNKYPETNKYASKYNPLLTMSTSEMLGWVLACAGKTGVLISGGSKLGDEDLLAKVKRDVAAGVDGLIFGRNMWQRSLEESLELTKKVIDILKKD